MKKVRIKTLPGLKQGGYPFTQMAPNYIKQDQGEAPIKFRDTLSGVPRDQANIEAEKGETVYIPNKDSIPAHYKIGGKRHYEGGTPLSVPPDSFVFSDTASMRIKDEELQKEFGMPFKKKGYTPAEIAKRYDINKYREILADPTEDKLAKLTAENMIKSYNLKLGKLSVIQESMKGYPGGIPLIATPYLMSIGVTPEAILPPVPQTQSPQEEMMEAPEMEMEEEEMVEEPMRYGGRTARLNNFVQGIRKKNNEFDPSQGLYVYMEEGGPVFYDANGIPAPEGVMPDEYRNGGLVQYDKGAEVKKKKQKAPPKDAVIIKRADYKTDAEYEAAKQEAYKKASDKTKVFVLDSEGTYKKVVSKPFTYPEYSGDDLDKVFKGKKDIAARYEYYKQRLSDPAVQAKLHEQYIKAFDNEKALRSDKLKTRKVSIENLKKLTPQQVADQLLEMQKRNLAFLAHGYDVAKTSNNPDEGDPVTNKALRGYAKEVGVEMPDVTNAAAQQLAYWAFEDLAGTDALPDFTKGQRGAADEKGSKSATISPADGIYTNTTAGQLLGVKGDPSITENPYEEYETEDITDGSKDPKLEVPAYSSPEMFQQDVIKMSQALGNMASLRKFMPNRSSVDFMTPDVAYQTPERQIAAGNEQLAIMKDALASSSPQQVSARNVGMAGTMFENAANVIGQVHNANIGTFNAFNQLKTGIENQERGFNAQAAKTYYDELTATNQNYNNSKRAAAGEFVNNLVQAKTNEAQAYNLNMLYPNYQVSPSAAGALYYYKPTPMEASASKSFSDIYAALRTDERLQELSPEDIAEIAKEMSGYSSGKGKGSSRSAKSSNDADWFNMQRGLYGNPQMTSYPNLEEQE